MKILLAQNMIYLPTLNGAIKGNRALVEGLAARNMSCRVVALATVAPGPGAREGFLRELAARGIRISSSAAGVDIFHLNRVEVHAVSDSAQLRSYLIQQIREFEPTWTIVPSEDPGQILLEAALKTSPSRVVYYAYTTQMLPCGPSGFLPSQTKTALLRQTAGIIALSHYVKEYIREWSGCESVVIPAPVYGPGPFPRLGCFDKGFVTIINPCLVKGITIFADLTRRLPNVQFAAVPTWGTTNADRAMLASLPNVQLLKPADNIDDIFAQTRVLLVPSLWDEAFGMVVVEAMLRGIPVLASAVGGLPEAKLGVDYLLPVRAIERYDDQPASRGSVSLAIPEQDITPWVEALERLISDHAHYEKLSAASRDAALAFVSNIGIAALEDFLTQLRPSDRADTSTAPARPKELARGDLSNVLDTLSSQQRAFLALRLRKKEEHGFKQQVIPRRAATDRVPLSFAQQRLWFLDRMDPGTTIYSLPGAFRFGGRLNLPALKRSLYEIVRRHEILRTIFPEVDKQPAQVILPAQPLEVPVIDLSRLPLAEREAVIRRLAIDEAQRPFDLARGPLLRITLLRLGDEEHVLLTNRHHIIFDGWSISIEFRELAALYKGFVTGKPVWLPEPALQYADYAVWQRAWLQGEVLEAQLAYWKRQLAGAPPVLELPIDYPRPARQTFRGAHRSFTLSQPLTTALQELSRREGATIFMVLLAAFKIELHRYTGQEDIVVGSPIAGRTRPELQGIIGNFVNTLVLRTNLSGNPSFHELLGRVREVALGGYAHQDLPFEKLVEELDPARSLSHSPVFQVVFGFQNAPKATSVELTGLSLGPLAMENEAAKADITLTMEEIGQGLIGIMQYNIDLFNEATIARMLGQYEEVLAGVVARPEAPLAALPWLTEAERQQLLAWSTPPPAAPSCLPIHALIAAQAARRPDACALLDGQLQLSYAALCARAAQLAHLLLSYGAGPDLVVALALPRSADLVVALLGVLSAGATFLPLDLAAPPARLADILQTSAAALLLTLQPLADTLPATTLPPLCLDQLAQQLATLPTTAPLALHPDQLAYVVFTSGSTGSPKGVAVAHRGLPNLVAAQADAFALTLTSRVLQFAPLSVDAGLAEVLVSLAAGATLVLAPEEARVPGTTLLAFLEQQAITTVTLPPTVLALLPVQPLPQLRTLVVAGEACSAELVARWGAARRMLNAYGPTEASVCASLGPLALGAPLTIGRPLAGSAVYVLDEWMQPVGVGVVGELYLGGDGLARGYLGRADLTAERFVPNPFWGMGDGGWGTQPPSPIPHPPSPIPRLYRTGDLARWLADGSLVFVGRRDRQVKVRAYRVELAEVEALLGTHPQVQAAVVLARTLAVGDVRLVAYLVTSDELQVTSKEDSSLVTRHSSLVTELRAYLKQRLPEYMVPADFVVLSALPLLPNGKVDHSALPASDVNRSARAGDFVAPRTPTEELLANIWSAVLRLDRIGIDDNFFDLGGHSLLAAQVIARVQDVFGVDLPLRNLFELPTLAAVAEQIDTARRTMPGVSTPPLRPAPREGPLPLSFAQQRLWFLEQLQPDSAVYNTPSPLRLRGPLDLAALTLSLNRVVARHEVLRTSFALRDGQPVQLIAPQLRLPLPLLDLTALPLDQRSPFAHQLASAEARQPFDLSRGPLLRSALLRLECDDHVVLLTTHHIVSDAWSMDLLLGELSTLYAATQHGHPAALPELPVQYVDYALWQRAWLQGQVLAAQLAFWKAQLADLPTLALPTDFARPPLQTFQGAHYPFSLPQPLRAELLALSRAQGVTLFMLLLAAFQLVLSRYSNQDEIAVGTPIAGRTRVEVENLIGFFLNTLVLRIDLSGNPTFQELLGRVREVCLQAYAHQDVPFEQVVEALAPRRDLSRHPLFQVLFSAQTATTTAAPPSAPVLQPFVVASTTTKFDLSLFVVDGAEGVAGALEYRTDLFSVEMIARLAGHLQTVLAAVVADPQQRIGLLPLITEAERQQLLFEWNATHVEFRSQESGVRSETACIQDLFAAQAARTPDVIAVVFDRPTTNDQRPTTNLGEPRTKNQEPAVDDDLITQNSKLKTQNYPHPFTPSPVQHLTYHKLNVRANHLAHYLQQLGVGPEVRVGICLERSLELVIALLGVLKAGGAYVPLDPDYPTERLAFMLEDAQVRVLLTTDDRPTTNDQRPTTNDVRPQSKIQNPKSKIVHLDADWPRISQAPKVPPAAPLAPDHLVYLIYTSGSTGMPKGAMNTHGAVVNRLRWMQETYRLCPDDAVLHKTSISFDVSVWELFWPLLNGARLVLARPGGQRESAYILELIAAQRITTAHFVPSMLQVLLAERDLARLGCLRRVICSGEALPLELQQRFFARLEAELHNLYGPTEAAIDVTFWACARGSAGHSVPIGRPVANTQLYLLDRHFNPVPVGVAGELHIGGVQLARGYLGRPDLTAERFVPNPFAGVTGDGWWVTGALSSNTQHPTPNTRLYKTGDLARYREDGAIEFLGRLDHQVKVRGYRIELGEIEAVLGTHAAVREAVVTLREDAPGEKRLVAYVVPKIEDRGLKIEDSGSSAPAPLSSILYPLSSELRRFLQARLPDYMVPAAFVLLDALPLTSNGKVDRQALPAPEMRVEPGEDFVASRNPIEEVLAQIWAGVLRRDQISVHDNFFTLGGHSLLAIQAIARVQDIFEVELPVRSLFEAPTLAGMAEQIENALREAQGLSIPPLRAAAREGPLPLSFAQQRLWFLDQLQPGSAVYNTPSPLRLRGPLNLAALTLSLNAVVARHEVLRTSFALRDGQPVQLIAPQLHLSLPLLDLSALPLAQRAPFAQRLASAEARQPFDLSRPPLLRAALLCLECDDHIVLLTTHHIVSDAWSMGVLLHELSTLYAAAQDGREAALPELPVQYADYALWQRTWLQGSGVRGQGTTPLPPPARGGTEGFGSLPPPARGGTEGFGSLPPPAGGGTEGGAETRGQGDKEHEAPDPPSPIPARPLRYACPPSPIERQLAYWRKQLADLPTLALPTDYPRPPVQTFEGAHYNFTLPRPLRAELMAFSRAEGVTLFMLLLAAFQVLLARYSNQDDIVVGMPIAGRTRVEVEPLIGFFVNMLALRTDLSGNPTFQELLARVREVCLSAYAHQDVPFEMVVEALAPTRDLSRHPLFQVMLSAQTTTTTAATQSAPALQPLVVASTTTKFDLSLFVVDGADGLAGALEYSTDLFTAEMIARLAGHFQTLIAAIAADPQQRIGLLPLITEAERQQVLVEWNATHVEFRSEESGVRSETACIQDLFAAQAARTPDVIAVVFDRPTTNDQRPTTNDRSPLHPFTPSPVQHLTYHKLNVRANHLAHYLQQLGVGPEVRVGICLERSLELVVALLGVLKAGGAYLPLDPSYPTERLAFMLEDAQASVLITMSAEGDTETRRHGNTETSSADSVTPSPLHPFTPSPLHSLIASQPAIVNLSATWPTIAAAPPSRPPCPATPDHLVYLIYTSGSTGMPKGAMNTHGAVVNRLRWMQETYRLCPDDAVLHKTSISFDVSVWELFWPLLNGARLVLARPGGQRESAYILELIAAQRITTAHFVPSMLQVLLAERDLARLGCLRRVICSGEALPLELQQRFFARLDAELHNLYGPTEAAIDVSAWACVPTSAGQSVPIGRPVANTQLYLLDRHFNPVPVGVAGELHIGGVQLARGYLGRPDLTAERFVPNPFAEVTGDGWWVTGALSSNTQHPTPNTRLYKTGDLARYRGDGAIEFLGRLDHQVKVRGYRIEPGEIETLLTQLPSVREAVVLAREALPGDVRLVAYVVPDHRPTTNDQRPKIKDGRSKIEDRRSPAFDPRSSILDPQSSVLSPQSLVNELRRSLQDKLPEYMIPSAFVVLDALPLLPSGKIDRRALPGPDQSRSDQEQPFEAPHTPVEELLAGIWQQVLGRERVGVAENFFALGGHSLLATQVVSRVREVFGVEVPLRALFEAPTVAGLAERIAAARSAGAAPPPPLRPVGRDQALPLSFSQQRLWFLDQLEPNNAAYQMPFPVRLTGALDVMLFHRSLNAIIRRHEALRTTFESVDGRPVQVIAAARDLPLPVLDLHALPEREREILAQQLAIADVRRPFDLARGPLVRSTLLRLSEAEHIILLNIHHIVSDGWSMGVFVGELATLYEAFAQGKPSPLPELPIQYADYAVWQRAWFQGEVMETQLRYWKHQLAGLVPLELPTDRPRPAIQTFRGAGQALALARELSAELAALSQREGVTLFMTLLAAFQALLARYSNQDDIVVGTFIANRHRPEVEPLIGFFVNNLVLRTNLSRNPTFREALGRVREVALGAYAHQDTPFEVLLEELQPERDLSRAPIFQVMIVMQNAPMPHSTLPGLTLGPIATGGKRSDFDLTLWLTEGPQGINGMLEYSVDLFDTSMIERMIGHIQTLLKGVVAQPDRPLADVPLLTDAERQQLFTDWHAGARIPTPDRCIHQMIEDQVARTPDAIALVYAGTGDWGLGTRDWETARTPNPQSPIPNPQLTYAELNRRANQLAHHLHALGVGPEVRVSICVERSPELVIGVLGVLKAGGAYVPLDPAYPRERLAFMLEDAAAPVLITTTNDQRPTTNDQRPTTNDRPFTPSPLHPLTLSPCHLVTLSDSWRAIARCAPDDPTSALDPANLAYVVYTSGSTGRPKGVMIAHRSLANAYLSWEEAYQLRSGSTCHLQMANFAFDVFSGDLVRALCSGAKLVLCPRELLLDAAKLYALMRRERVDSAEFVPAVLRNVVLHLEQTEQSLSFMRLLAVGSDSWYAKEYEHVRRFCGSETRLINSYGLSEATIDSTYFEGSAHQLASEGMVPIGRPFHNAGLYLLDARMQPVPIGVPGEIYVGGAGLARGYLNRPDVTAERFVPNPFAGVTGDGCWVLEDSAPNTQHPTPNTRLYRTGDLARYRADGNVEFLRRIDHQVKVRGFRVELGEIEAVLGRHPAVRECVLLAYDSAPGDTRLVAYVVPTNDQRPTTNEQRPSTLDSSSVLSPQSSVLRAFLQTHVPDYMIPSAVVLLDAFPLTPNGKVDRQALPAPSMTRSALDDDFEAPRTQIEEILAQIWAGVLRLDRVGARDNFFALGGHSLLVTQVIARVYETFQVELPLRRMFEAPTVAELAQHIEIARNAAQGLRMPPLQPIPRDGTLSLSFAQQRLWFIDQLEPNNPAYNIPTAVRLTGLLDMAALKRSLSAVVRRHEALRTTFTAIAGQPLQVIGPALALPLPLVDLHALPLAAREEAVRRLARAEGRRPFDLAHGPLLRATLLRTGEQEHVLLLTMHHIVSDGWSVGVLIREVTALYGAFSTGAPVPLPELPIQYADFAHWQRQWLQGDALEMQLSYWKRQLGGAPAVLELPTDRPRPAVQSFRGASQPVLLSPDLSAALQALSRQERTTLFMTLLAAFQLLLARYSGQEDIVVGTDIASRTHVALEGLIGFFVNQLVLRTNLTGDPTFRELLVRVREIVLAAYAHQDLPFEKLVEVLRPRRSIAHTPLFQVKIVFQNAPMPARPTGDLSVSFLAIDNQTTKYDLTLFLIETERGIRGTLEYNTDLFEGATVARMARHFETLLGNIVAQPDTRSSQLAIYSEAERRQQTMDQQERKAAKLKKFMSVAPKAVSLANEEMIKSGSLQPGQALPLVIQPALDQVDLIDWAQENQEFIETVLRKHGAVLFRDFAIDSVARFEAFALTLCPELFKENGEHTPVSTSSHIQTPVFYPPNKKLLWHNENSFNRQWPLKIWFCCSKPAQRGGETPIVDSRKVFELLDQRIRERFVEQGVMYVRNYGEGLGLSWQTVFQTEDPLLVEQHCRENGMTFEWKDGDRLCTRQVRPAAIRHPKTGEMSWFNQAQHWHVSCLDAATRESMLSLFREEDLPRNCYYGDGSPIEDSAMSAILDVYQQLEISFPWQQGDVMLLDNLLIAHGRNPFEGERKILVALGEMMSYDDVRYSIPTGVGKGGVGEAPTEKPTHFPNDLGIL